MTKFENTQTLYVIKHPTLPLVKLGCTKQPKRRLYTYTREFNTKEIQFEKTVETKDFKRKEASFHWFHTNKRAKYKYQLEWYPDTMLEYLLDELTYLKDASIEEADEKYEAMHKKRQNNNQAV